MTPSAEILSLVLELSLLINNFFLIYYKVIKKIFVITKVGSCLDYFYFYFQIKQKSIIWYFQKTNKVKMLFKKLKILKILTHTIYIFNISFLTLKTPNIFDVLYVILF